MQNDPRLQAADTNGAPPAMAQTPQVRRAPVMAVLILAAFLFGALVYLAGFRAELDQASARGQSELALASDRLTTGLQRYRELAVFIADHPTAVAFTLSQNRTAEGESAANSLLRDLADKTGAYGVLLVSDAGDVLARTAGAELPDGAAPAFKRALDGALGATHFVDDAGRRRYLFAAPVFFPHGAARGAVLVSVDVGALEWGWPTAPSPTYFTDETGLIFVSNRAELALRGGAGPALPVRNRLSMGPHDIMHLNAGPYIPRRALHLVQPLPVVGLTGELLLDLSSVRAFAALQAGLATALVLFFVGLLYVAMERRQSLADANQRLEARVAKRTAALEAANAELMREVAEREEAEARLKRAQADLVQAGKLTALGEMSAGISHELNQPLMAIRSFAENGQAFLERDRPEKAGENLGRISELARRMGRIIKNLRAFARQENEAVSDVDLANVVDAALEMTQAKITQAGAQINWAPPEHPIIVRGGDVRLQQVVMNLVSNAVDAMAQSEIKQVNITIEDADPAVLRVADTGPGIAAPDKIFDPFYTTKEVGAAQGMGLGLSISYGLIQSFGGQIKGMNAKEGGAVFTIALPRAPRKTQAQATGKPSDDTTQEAAE